MAKYRKIAGAEHRVWYDHLWDNNGVKPVKLGEEPMSARGIVGTFRYTETYYGERVMVAVNPLQRKRVLDSLAEIKKQRLSKTSETVTDILEALYVKEGPTVDLTNPKDEPDRKVWLLELVNQPRLFINMGNWAITNDLSFLEDCGIDFNDSVLFIIVDQSLPSINRILVGTKAWKCQSITVMAVTSKEVKVDQMQGQEHPFVTHILQSLHRP